MPAAKNTEELIRIDNYMVDLLSAQSLEFTAVKNKDGTHKLWVNVDGVCVLRINECKLVVSELFDQPRRELKIIKTQPDVNKDKMAGV